MARFWLESLKMRLLDIIDKARQATSTRRSQLCEGQSSTSSRIFLGYLLKARHLCRAIENIISRCRRTGHRETAKPAGTDRMSQRQYGAIAAVGGAIIVTANLANAAQCGNTGAGFETWKKAFAAEAKGNGVKAKAISALLAARYSVGTIKADRNQSGLNLSLSAFMAKRGAAGIAARGKSLKNANAALFASIEKRYGVPAGPLIAIWGMETGFGRFTGNQNMISAVATLAYDCRRTEYFTEHLYAALKLIDRGVLSASTRGAMQGEMGQTQFLPKNILLYGGGNLNSKTDALASTARFLKAHGWKKGAGYQPGQPNFPAIQSWNAASVYQRAIAIIGKQIDEN
jgi:membrane-bound lytic murein transglycosylase B